MKQTSFEKRFSEDWKRFDQSLQLLRSRQVLSANQQEEFASLYRRICQHQSLAKSRCYSTNLMAELTRLVSEGHQCLYRRKRNVASEWLHFIVTGFPSLVRQEARYIWAAMALLYLPGLALMLAVLIDQDVIYYFISADQVYAVENMYDPSNSILGEARDSGSDFQMFGYYIWNNISISFRTFSGGLMLGLGTIYILIHNGLLLGGLSAHMINVGFVDTFFPFVVGHGAFELTAIGIAGAAGLRIGFALLRPGNRPRLQALKMAGKVAIQLMCGVILMLVIAAFIEGFWSSSTLFGPWQKYLVGASLWTAVILYLTRSGVRREA